MIHPHFESRLTLYKTNHDCRYFGEALLAAASEGHLGAKQVNDTPTQEVLWQLGIALTMTRDQITICLSRPVKQHSHLIAYLANKHSLSSTRNQLAQVINSAICYTEQHLPDRSSLEIAEIFA